MQKRGHSAVELLYKILVEICAGLLFNVILQSLFFSAFIFILYIKYFKSLQYFSELY